MFICRAILASAIVPPWQGPDEPTHFSLTQRLALPDRGSEAERRTVEEQVLRSMGRHRWWEPYGGHTPDPIPTSFSQIIRLGIGTYAQPLYYSFGAGILRLTRPADVEAAYWRLRVASVVLSLATLAVGWAGTRLLFGAEVGIGAAAIAALHPQFLLSAIAVNPNALVNFWGAFMWWQAARLFSGRSPGMSRVLVIVAAAAALLTQRVAVPLAGVAAVLILVSLVGSTTAMMTRRNAFLAGTAMVVGAVILWAAQVAFQEQWTTLATYWRAALTVRRPSETATLSQALESVRISIDYVWLIGGWVRFPAPEPWLWVARVLTVAGFAGAGSLLFRWPLLRWPLSMAWLFVTVQVVVVIGLSFWTLASPQGRYLFPVLAPATALLWLGFTRASPAWLRPYAAPALIAILAVMDVTAFTTVLIPAYLPW